MVLIDKADALLKECAATRAPKTENIDPMQSARAVAQTRMAQYKNKSMWTERKKSNASLRWGYGLLTAAILYAILGYVFEHHGKYTFKEAQEACREKGQVLPLTPNDFFESGYKFGQPAEYWTANGKVMFPPVGASNPPEDTNGYGFLCVDKNGLDSSVHF